MDGHAMAYSETQNGWMDMNKPQKQMDGHENTQPSPTDGHQKKTNQKTDA